MTIRTFRDLVAWQRAMELCRRVYAETRRMPAEERFGLTNQMRRCAVSVPSNIAEGYGRSGRADYVRFLSISRGSLCELMTQYELATTMGLIESCGPTLELMSETERVLQGLITSLTRKKS